MEDLTEDVHRMRINYEQTYDLNGEQINIQEVFRRAPYLDPSEVLELSRQMRDERDKIGTMMGHINNEKIFDDLKKQYNKKSADMLKLMQLNNPMGGGGRRRRTRHRRRSVHKKRTVRRRKHATRKRHRRRVRTRRRRRRR